MNTQNMTFARRFGRSVRRGVLLAVSVIGLAVLAQPVKAWTSNQFLVGDVPLGTGNASPCNVAYIGPPFGSVVDFFIRDPNGTAYFIGPNLNSKTRVTTQTLESCGFENVTNLTDVFVGNRNDIFDLASVTEKSITFKATVPVGTTMSLTAGDVIGDGTTVYTFRYALTGPTDGATVFTSSGIAPASASASAPTREETQKDIENFVKTRASSVFNTQPNLSNFVAGVGSFGPNTAVSMSANDLNDTLFFTSRSDLSSGQRRGKIQAWAEAYGARTKADQSNSSLLIGFAGAHYFLSESSLVGVVTQLDWAEETNRSSNSSAKGRGWMVGPYAAGQIVGSDVFYDVSLRYGRSQNSLSPNGTYTDRFGTQRIMAAGKLSGAFTVEGFVVRPEIGLSYYREVQDSYTDGLGTVIPSTVVSFGEARFGPRVEKTFDQKGMEITPHLALTGVYNYALSGNDATQATALGKTSLRAQLAAGATATLLESGAIVAFEGFYDGIGVNAYESYGARFRLTWDF